jgi:tetratricopeptide (TPR) repeat protein
MPDHPTRSVPPVGEPVARASTTERAGDPTGPDAPPAVAALPVARAGRYELLGEIARGGMGVVYRARDTALHRDVAVKVLQERFPAESAAARRFVEEAQITSQLQHPGIPPVHDVGTLPDGRPFLVMKLIKGQTLEGRLAGRDRERREGAASTVPDPDPPNLIAVFEQVCQTIAYAHSRGVIHRDLKPANIMVGTFGEVQVMDWGVAKFQTDTRSAAAQRSTVSTFYDPREDTDGEFQTRTGAVLGTPAFMAPEQAIGAVDLIDERSDVFGLGGLLCAILTGQPPFVGDTAEPTRQLAALGKVDDAFTRLAGCGADPGLVALCKRCLAPEKVNRPRGAGEVAVAVQQLRAEVEERARQAELDRVRAEDELRLAAVRAAEVRKRRRVQAALTAAVGALMVGAGVFAWWQDKQDGERRVERERADGEKRAAEFRRQIEDERRTADERARQARTAEAVAALAGQCEDALRADDTDRAGLLLAAAERRAAEGGAEQLGPRLGRCRDDLAALRALDAIDTFRWTPVESRLPDGREVAARCRAALAGYGAAAGETPAVAARRVADSLIRDRLLAALDLWLINDPSASVQELLRSTDPDEYRDAVRDAIAARDEPRQADLAGRPEALAQPLHFAAVLGQLRAVPADRRRALLGAALRSRPGDLTLLMALGNSYLTSDPESAAERARWFQAAVAAHPRNVAAQIGLGAALFGRGDPVGAVACFREAARLDPADARARYNLGRALAGRKDHDGALAEYREAVRLDPTLVPALVNLGSILCDEKRDFDGAITAYEAAIRLDPSHVRAHYNLGVALAGKKDLDGAVRAYAAAIRLDPGHFRAHHELGVALAGKRDFDGAVAAFQAAVRLDPTSVVARKNLDRAVQLKEARDRIAPPPREVGPGGRRDSFREGEAPAELSCLWLGGSLALPKPGNLNHSRHATPLAFRLLSAVKYPDETDSSPYARHHDRADPHLLGGRRGRVRVDAPT